ncbi:MAG: MBL fold metallo-hydrolase [Rhizobiales bacterium]|nr:MBL fold metallo-hydrolase [Hyphomicrobiales bacterium]
MMRAPPGACSMSGTPDVTSFFDAQTNTFSYLVRDPAGRACAIIDSVLDLDYAAGAFSYAAADRIVDHVRAHDLDVQWLLETHVHADHLSAAPYLQQKLGGRIAIGAGVRVVQEVFGKVFNEGTAFRRDGSQFDRLFEDGDAFALGALEVRVLHTPGHTPACLTYLIGDAAFVGDTLFMPDGGTARADFPGGDARQLYRSIRRILDLPPGTRLFMCHDYGPNGREIRNQTTVAEQRAHNIHVRDGMDEDAFVDMRTRRDASLAMPRLILPSLQVNMKAGALPEPDADGRRFLKVPLTGLSDGKA